MIHYHGTPLGGKVAQRPEFFLARHALVPWTYKDDIDLVKQCCQSFVLDNGAYTLWNRGEEQVDWNGYYEWVESLYRHPSLDWAIIPDTITGSEEDNDALLSQWPKELERIGIPVYHLHESLERAQRLVETYPRVAIGSSGDYSDPGGESWEGRMNEVMRVMCDELGRPKAKLHGLRMLDPMVFTKWPFASCDSTNACQNGNAKAKRSNLDSTVTGQVVIAKRVEIFQSAETWTPQKTQRKLLFA